jgi:predicted RNA-binding Zn-ribbon protein involved in translation (DUF1610 family)
MTEDKGISKFDESNGTNAFPAPSSWKQIFFCNRCFRTPKTYLCETKGFVSFLVSFSKINHTSSGAGRTCRGSQARAEMS